MIILKTADELDKIRVACQITAKVRDELAEKVSPGYTTQELDSYAAELIAGFEAKSAFKGYHGFPGHVCISVNEEVVHGIPGARRIMSGDVVSLDVGVEYDGYIGDTATTVMVGVTDPDIMRLVTATKNALYAGISKAVVGSRISDISHAVEKVAKKDRIGVVRDFVGHGVGKYLHEEPQIPNFGAPGKGPEILSGMTLAIEPMFNLGAGSVEVLNDGWTVVTSDRKVSAHF
ncbi:MAG: type I methionyl aminopeptidase, partial [Lentisphaerae bacterium]|nr:type I methionyl aminopeptidase [Lentisphaerota bacterium]